MAAAMADAYDCRPSALVIRAASAGFLMFPHSTSAAGRVDKFNPPKSDRAESPPPPM